VHEGSEISQSSRQNRLVGVNLLADAISITFGPAKLKQGISAAPRFALRDPEQDAAARLLIEIASKTADIVGDGTTVTVVLARRIYSEAVGHVANGHDPAAMKRGIDKAVEAAVKALQSMSRQLQDPVEIVGAAARASGADPAVGLVIVEAMKMGGPHRLITLGDASARETRLERVSGVRLDRGYLSPFFMTDPIRSEAALDEPYILLCDQGLASAHHLMPLLRKMADAGKSLLIIAPEIDDETLGMIVLEKLAGKVRVCAAKSMGFGDRVQAILADIAILTGGKVLSPDRLASADLTDLGRARRATVDRDQTTIIDGKGSAEALQRRIADVKQAIEDTNSDYDREKTQERMVMLSDGAALIHLGGSSGSSLSDAKQAVEDTLSAVYAVVTDGVVPGGGVAYLRCAPALDGLEATRDELAGIDAVRGALEEPCRLIAVNAGLDGAEVVAAIKARAGGWGLNAETGQYEDLAEAGIVDPTKCARWALQNAASATGILLTNRKVIDEIIARRAAL
jgi:chaperonin GroEL